MDFENDPRFVIDATREVTRTLDGALHLKIIETKANAGIKCKPHCWQCCTLYVSATLPEGIVIAEHLRKNPDIVKGSQLDAAVKEHADIGYDTLKYFQLERRCVFLSTNNLCKIYEERPTSCRTYFVSTDPARCGQRPSAGVISVDTSQFRRAALEQYRLISKDAELPVIIAPLPVAVKWGLYYVDKGPQAWREHFFALPETNMMSPIFWRQQVMAGMVELLRQPAQADIKAALEKEGVDIEDAVKHFER